MYRYRYENWQESKAGGRSSKWNFVKLDSTNGGVQQMLQARVRIALGVAIGLFALSASAQPQAPAPDQKLFRAIYQELIEINTSDSVGDNTQAAQAMAARLKAGGFS